MDPNAALGEARELAQRIAAGQEDLIDLEDQAERLAEVFTGLRDGEYPVPSGSTAKGWAHLQGVRERKTAEGDG